MKIKYLALIIIISFISIRSSAQNMSSGYFVVPNPVMDNSVQEQLGNKIKVAISKAGVMATDGYFPMVTVVKYDETETIEIEGMRKMYKTMGNVTILITFTNTNASLAATDFAVEGVGISRKISQANAVKNIKIPEDELKTMMNTAKVNYDKALKDYTAGRLAEAKKYKANHQYSEALEVASEIRPESEYYKEAQKLVAEINKIQDKEAADAQKRADKESEREYELRKEQLKNQNEQIKQNAETERQSINARARVVERYYRAWQAYYSGR